MERCQKFEWKKIRDTNPNLMECMTEGCDNMFIKDDETQTYFFCSSCGVEYCLRCEMVYHVEKTCEEIQEAKQEEEMREKAFL